jgi:3-oxoacyl-[acyl-carrier protein] reductase
MDKPGHAEKPVALVTGARTGIGRFLCEHLLKQGYQVMGCSRKGCDLEADGFHYVQADVTVEKDVKHLFRELQRVFGRVDAVINNAGAANMNHFLLMPVETYQRLMDTNVLGTWLVCREAAKMMRRRKYGRIVNFGSAALPIRLAGEAVYLAAKSAVEVLSQTIAREVIDYGVTVNVVGPAPVATEMIRGVPKEKIDRLLEMMTVRRMCTFEDVANVVDFFLRKESDAVTGQVVYLGGVPNT